MNMVYLHRFQLTLVFVGTMAHSSACATDKPEAEIAKAISNLGSPSFRVRQAAQAKILEFGPQSIPALKVGAKSSDAEVARLCDSLIRQIWTNQCEGIISGKQEMPGHAGKRFKELVGDSKASRVLFTYMFEDYRRAMLAEQAAEAPAKACQLYRDEVSWIDEVWKKRFADFPAPPLSRIDLLNLQEVNREVVSPGEVVLIFFLGSYALGAGEQDAPDVESALKTSFITTAKLEAYREPFRKLFIAWLYNRKNDKAIRAGLYGALYGVIPEAVPIARRIASDPKAEASIVGTAALLLGNFGSMEDEKMLEALKDDKRTYDSPELGKVADVIVQLQVRDQAMGMALRLWRKRMPMGTFGFRLSGTRVWWTSLNAQPFETVVHFKSDKERDKAHRFLWTGFELANQSK